MKCQKCQAEFNTDYRKDKKYQKKQLPLFCSRSCANSRRFTSKSKEKMSMFQKDAYISKVTALSQKHSIFKEAYIITPTYCCVCNTILPYERRMSKACNKKCLSVLLSQNAKANNLGGSTHQSKLYTLNNGLTAMFDSSWEFIMANDLINNNITWVQPAFFKLSNGCTYTPDFFLPLYNVYIDPKAITAFHTAQPKQLENIKLFEQQFQTKCILIHSKQNLKWEFIKEQL